MSENNSDIFVKTVISCSLNDHKNPNKEYLYTNIVYFRKLLELLDLDQRIVFYRTTIPEPDPLDIKELASWIKMTKLVFNLKSVELSRIGGVSKSRISQLENEKDADMSLDKKREFIRKCVEHLCHDNDIAA